MHTSNSLTTKIIILILIVIIPLIAFLFFDNFYSMSLIKKQVAQSNINLLSVYMSQLDNRLGDISNYLRSLSENDLDVTNYSKSSKDSEERARSINRLTNRLSNQISYNNNVDLFFLYSAEDGDLVLASRDNSSYELEMVKKKIEVTIFIMEMIGSNEWQLMDYYGNYKLIKMIDTGMGTYLGAWVGLESLIEPLNKLDLGEHGGVHIITDKGFSLISTFADREKRQIFSVNEIDFYNRDYKIVRDPQTKEKFLMVADTLENLPIDFIAMMPEKELYKNLLTFRRMIYYIPIAGVFVLVIYLLLIRGVLFSPMKKLMNAMSRVSQGDLDVRLVEDSSNEFNFLFSSFNNMVERVQTLKMGIYEEEILLQKAELKHLQSQIKPHFFLNSLNIVYNLAVLKKFESIKQMTLHLGNYLRFTLKNGDQPVTLEEELEHIKNYLEIQKLRFVNRFNYNIISNETLNSVLIPPLTIQPFVENSIVHGYNKKVDVFTINISVNKENEYLIIRIKDNGKGFSPGKLLELQGKNFDRDNGEHIGIWNVYRRLIINYGNDIDLTFNNRQDGGSIVSIKIPYFQGKGRDENDKSLNSRR